MTFFAQTDKPKTICSFNFFEDGRHKKVACYQLFFLLLFRHFTVSMVSKWSPKQEIGHFRTFETFD